MTEPLSIDAAIARIKAYAAVRGWKKSRLAMEAGLGDTTLRDFDRDDWNPTAQILRRIEAVIPTGWKVGDPIPQALADCERVQAEPAEAAA